MYQPLKKIFLLALRSPSHPPAPPAGTHDSLIVFRASPAWLRYRLLMVWISIALYILSGLVGLVFMVAAETAHGLKFTTLFTALTVLFFLFSEAFLRYFLTRLDYDMRYYILTDRSLRIREGVMSVQEITLTFENIQNMAIQQGPLQRFFGVADLVVETAGGSTSSVQTGGGKGETISLTHQAVFRGLERPGELRDKILEYLRRVRSAGLGDHEEHTACAAGPGFDTGTGEKQMEALRAIVALTREWRREIQASPASTPRSGI